MHYRRRRYHFIYQKQGGLKNFFLKICLRQFIYRIFAIKDKESMAIHKKEEFTQKEQDLAAFAKALSHPARIAILKVLAQKNECICGEIVDVLPLAQSTVSQHLKELKNAGLITGETDGPRSCYCINWKAFEKFNNDFNSLSEKLKEVNAKCCSEAQQAVRIINKIKV
jgi:DNA-binding transcriptional ArsR family regulator